MFSSSLETEFLKPKCNRSVWRLRVKWDDNIKTDKEVGCKDIDWIYLPWIGTRGEPLRRQ